VFMLLLLKDLLTRFVVTCTLKNKLTMWLCLIEGYLASLTIWLVSRLSTQNAL
jgi:hypothetical protein